MNMSYCRFRNTLIDLEDCKNNLPNKDLSREEAKAFAELIELCKKIAEDYENYDYHQLIELSNKIIFPA